jgi:hypothetical protein
MKTRSILALSLVALSLICSMGIATAETANQADTQAVPAVDTPDPYNGTIGPDNALYGLKIAFENLDESFTVNESERLEKQVSHADTRLAELKRELAENRTESADRALDLYRQKLNQTETALEPYASNETGALPGVNAPAMEHAREMIAQHQKVLENLLSEHPDNPGLSRAYNNSLVLEQKFENRLEQKPDTRNGQTSGQESNTMTRQGSPDFGQNRTSLSDAGDGQGIPGNRTLSEDKARIWDDTQAGNGTRQDHGMNRTMSTDSQDRNQNQNFPQVSNQTAGNQQQTGTDKSAQKWQDNPNGDNAGRNTGSGNGNSISPGNTQNGNTPGNNGGANQGTTTHTTVNPGGQGQSTDQRMRSR